MMNAKSKLYRLLGIHAAAFCLLLSDCLYGCPFYRISGLRCPGCGLTRAWLSFLSGNLEQAVSLHLFFLPAPLFIFLFAHRDAFPIPLYRKLDPLLSGFAAVLAVYHLYRVCLVRI